MFEISEQEMQQEEKRILAELVKNSKEKTETIAKHCGFTKQKAGRIIKQLEANDMIWGYTTIFDEQRIGLSHFILLVKREMQKIKEEDVDILISKKTEQLAEEFGVTIESSAYIHGEYDWILTFTASDVKLAKKFINSLLALYPRIINKITIMQTLMFMKNHYVSNPQREKLKEFM